MPYCFQCGTEVSSEATYCSSCGARQDASSPDIRQGNRRTAHIQERNMVMQVLLCIVTLGIYSIYWFYVTLKEIHTANGSLESPLLWTVLSVIPFANLFAYWHYSFEFEKFTTENYPGIAMFILWVVISPVVWFLVQRDLNKEARAPSPRLVSSEDPSGV